MPEASRSWSELNRRVPMQMFVGGQWCDGSAGSFAVLDPSTLRDLIPDYASKGAPLDCPVTHDDVYFLTEKRQWRLPLTPPPLTNHGCFVISINAFVKWLAQQVEAAGIDLFTGFAASEVLYEDDRVVGVRTGDRGLDRHGGRKPNFEPGVDLRAKVTIFCDGVRGNLTKTLVQFAKEYPKVKVRIVFGTSDELIERLTAAELDLILTFKEDRQDPQFKHEVLFSSPLTLVTAKTTKLASRKSISLEEINGLPLALPASGYSTSRFITNVFKSKRLTPEVAIEINDIPTLLAIVKTGNWHTILTKISVAEQDLVTIPIEGKKMSRIAMAVSLSDAYPKRAMLAFSRMLKKENQA